MRLGIPHKESPYLCSSHFRSCTSTADPRRSLKVLIIQPPSFHQFHILVKLPNFMELGERKGLKRRTFYSSCWVFKLLSELELLAGAGAPTRFLRKPRGPTHPCQAVCPHLSTGDCLSDQVHTLALWQGQAGLNPGRTQPRGARPPVRMSQRPQVLEAALPPPPAAHLLGAQFQAHGILSRSRHSSGSQSSERLVIGAATLGGLGPGESTDVASRSGRAGSWTCHSLAA